MLLNNECVNNELGNKLKSVWKQMKINIQQSKTYGTQERGSEREVHSNTGLPKKDRNISNKPPNPTSIKTRGTTANKAQSK